MQAPVKAPTAYIDAIIPATASAGQAVKFQGHGTDPDGTVVGFKWRSSINGDLSAQASFETSSLAPGNHTITLAVQDNNGNWSKEASSSITITGTAPPPAASQPVVTAFIASPANISPGGSATLKWDVANASTVSIDQGVGNVSLTGTRTVYPGATTVFTLTATGAGGTTTANVEVLVGSTPTMPIPIPIPIPVPGTDKPDLIVTDISRSGSTITYTIKNQGTATAGPSTSILTVDGVLKANDPVGPLAAGASSNKSFAYSYSCSGTSDALAVQVDKDNVVDESNEGNNAYSESWSCLIILPPLLPLLKADLVVTNIWRVGNKINYTIKNQGAIDAPASKCELFVDGVSKGYDNVATIPAGASVNGVYAAYAYTCSPVSDSIKIVADALGAVNESDEGNNSKSIVVLCP